MNNLEALGKLADNLERLAQMLRGSVNGDRSTEGVGDKVIIKLNKNGRTNPPKE